MNDAVLQDFAEALHLVNGDRAAAANLALASALRDCQPTGLAAVEPASRSYTVKETAARLGVSTKSIYQLALDGRLRSYRVGRAIRVPAEDIERFQSERSALPATLPLSANNEHGVL